MYWLLYSSNTSHHPSQTPCFPCIFYVTQNWCSIRWSKSSLKHSIRFCGIFPSLKQNIIAYHSSKLSSCLDCIFEIHQLWQSGLGRVYSNCRCSCSFEPEIIKIGQSSHKMYSNKHSEFSRVYNNFKCPYEKSRETYRMHLVYSIINLFYLLLTDTSDIHRHNFISTNLLILVYLSFYLSVLA